MCNVCKQKWFVYSIGGGFHRVLAWFSGRTLGLNNTVLPEGHAKFFSTFSFIRSWQSSVPTESG